MLTWARDLEWNTEAFLASSGSVVIGNVRSTTDASRWRWEIAGLPGMFSRVDERSGWVNTMDEAKAKVQSLFDQWLASAQLVPMEPLGVTTIGIFGDPDTIATLVENSNFDEVVRIIAGKLLLSQAEVERLFGAIVPETGFPLCTKDEWNSAPSDDRETFFYSFCNLYDSLRNGR